MPRKPIREKQPNVKNIGRNERNLGLFNVFRLDPHGDPNGIYKNIAAINGDKSLTQWALETPINNIKVTMDSFARCVGIHGYDILKLKLGEQQWIDVIINQTELEAEQFYTAASHETVMSSATNAFNLLVKAARKEYLKQDDNINDHERPAYLSDEFEIKVELPFWRSLKEVIDSVKAVCALTRPDKVQKSIPMSTRGMLHYIFTFGILD